MLVNAEVYCLCVQMTAQTTADVQKQYLAGVQYLFDQGLVLMMLCLFTDNIVCSLSVIVTSQYPVARTPSCS